MNSSKKQKIKKNSKNKKTKQKIGQNLHKIYSIIYPKSTQSSNQNKSRKGFEFFDITRAHSAEYIFGVNRVFKFLQNNRQPIIPAQTLIYD